MFRHAFPLLLFSLLLSLSSCSSGKAALKQGEYLDAVMTSINRLRQSPGSKRAGQALERAYPLLVRYNLNQIDIQKQSSDPFRWEQVIDLYAQLNQVYDEIQRAPGALNVIPNPGSYIRELEQSRIKGAEARYALGEGALREARRGNREAAKDAFAHYETANSLQPGFRDCLTKMEEARELALVRVVLAPLPQMSRILEVTNEFFYNQMVEYLQENTFSPFVLFYQPEDAEREGIRPDQVVRLAFDDFVVGQVYVQETIEDRSRDSVVIGTVDVKEGDATITKDVYGTVKAKVHLFRKAIDTNGRLDLQITTAASGTVVSQRKFDAGYTWFDYWGFFNGDERALTDEDKRRLRNNREIMPPPPQFLFQEFTKPLFRDVTVYLRNYYETF